MKNNHEFDIHAVVLANGSYPDTVLPLHILKTAPYLIACDGATNELVHHGITPDIIVGDGDSISPENKKKYKEIFHQVDDQETNDLTKAINYLFSIGKTNIAIVGATGGRDDHALGNISLLIEHMRRGVNIRMFTDYGVFIPMNGTHTFKVMPGRKVSIFNFGAKNMKSEGLKYPIYDFTNWWQGTLNESINSEFTIEADGDYLVYMAY